MKRLHGIGCSLALLIGANGLWADGPDTAPAAQQPVAAKPAAEQPVAAQSAAPARSVLGLSFPLATGLGSGGACADGTCADEKWGAPVPQDAKILQGLLCDDSPWKLYGWFDSGYTNSNHGKQLMTTQPRENRFSNEYIFNQIALVFEKPLKGGCEFDWGFNATFYAGADAALLRPRGGFTTDDPRFGADFRQLYVSAHLPMLSEGGVDVKVGRIGTIIGYESALAPYRPFYSNDYQWFYSEDGAWTGALANWHVSPQLDVLAGVTLGANTFFTLRGNGPCYIGQVNYWLQEEKRTMLTASVQVGNQAIFSATPAGSTTFVFELRVQHDWNKYLTQIVQSNNGWEDQIPGVGTGEWWSAYNIFVFHASKNLDLNNRVEWFNDVNGTRIGTAARNYGEVTAGADYHPRPWLRLRPEARYDFADGKAFDGFTKNNQWTLAFDVLFQF